MVYSDVSIKRINTACTPFGTDFPSVCRKIIAFWRRFVKGKALQEDRGQKSDLRFLGFATGRDFKNWKFGNNLCGMGGSGVG